MSLAGCGGPPPHYDYRPDIKAPYTTIVRAHDQGELSLNGVLRRKVTYHGHGGVCALYARFAPDASSHLADRRSRRCGDLGGLHHAAAPQLRDRPDRLHGQGKKAAIVVARRGIFGGTIREMVTRVTSGLESSISPLRGGDGGAAAAV